MARLKLDEHFSGDADADGEKLTGALDSASMKWEMGLGDYAEYLDMLAELLQDRAQQVREEAGE